MRVLVIVGYGPGISHAVAERFAREGYSLALIGRRLENVAESAAAFDAAGTNARGYQADASDPQILRGAMSQIRTDLGPISTILWTAFRGGNVKDVLSTRPELVGQVFDIGVTGLLTCVQTVLDDLKASDGASVLVANGALGENSSEADAFAKYLDNDGVALENAAKSKLVGLLSERLREFDIYVGEVTIVGSVAGTATADPAAIEPAKIADQFWALTQTRDTTRFRMTP